MRSQTRKKTSSKKWKRDCQRQKEGETAYRERCLWVSSPTEGRKEFQWRESCPDIYFLWIKRGEGPHLLLNLSYPALSLSEWQWRDICERQVRQWERRWSKTRKGRDLEEARKKGKGERSRSTSDRWRWWWWWRVMVVMGSERVRESSSSPLYFSPFPFYPSHK